MNRAYKVIWSKARHCYVVVSELAKSHGKTSTKAQTTSGRKIVLASLAAAVLTFGSYGLADAAGQAATENGPASEANGIASIAVGVGDKVVSSNTDTNRYQGATSLAVGTLNIVDADDKVPFDGVASSVIGQVNYTKNANAAVIMGADNRVTNSYRDVKLDDQNLQQLTQAYLTNDMQTVKEILQNAVPESGGQVMAFGGGNVVDNAYMTQVIGVGNTVKGNQKKNDDGTWTSKDNTGFKDDTSSQLNYVDGFYTTLINGKSDYLIGAHNTVTGDSVDKNHSNIVIGDNHTLENQSNNIILGSADSTLPTTASQVTIVGHNANATIDGGVAIGSGSIANVEKGQKGYYVKHDQRSEEGEGYPFQNNEKYKPQSAWISRAGAVSVGDTTNEDQSKWITRQITGVAAGTKDTDAVNVAQLKNSQTRFYSIYDPGDNWLGIFPQIPNWEKYKNENNQGAQGYWSMAAGFGTSTGGIASTVIGSLSKIDNKWTDGKPNGFQGVTAVSVGTLNFNLSDQVTDNEVHSDDPSVIFQSKEESGVANSIVGQGNLTKNSNGALIYGAGNIVTDSYRRVVANGDNDLESLTNQDMESLLSNPEKAIKTLGKIVDISGGKVMAIGGGNVVDKAYDSQVMGVGNTVVGDAVNFEYKESPEVSNLPESTWDEQVIKNASRDADVWTQYMGSIRKQGTLLNLVDGYYSTLKNGQNDYLIGTANEVTGDPSKNKSNIVFGDYHKLNNGNNNIIIGSADGAVVEKAKGYFEDYESGITTSQEITSQKQHTENLEDAVMIGHNADVQKNGGVAIGAGSVASVDKASVDKNAIGYDPATKKPSTVDSSTWKSTAAAVSVGDASKNITRQITNVAAGTQDTDAVNVAQLQKALSGAKDGNDTLKSNTNALKLDGNTLSMNVEDTAGHKVSGSVDLSKFAQVVDTNTTYTLTGEANPDNNTTTITLKDSNGRENSVTVATKDTDTRNTVRAGENVTLDTKDNSDGSHEYTVNVKADGKVEAGSTKIVSGGTVYNETRVAKDGNFVKQSNTAGENLSALDNQVTANTESIYHMNGRISDLDNRVNKVGAGAAALAALHPLDFDPDDKWDFAVGYGNYRNANSVAFGAFYRPNEDTMFSLGTNFGNGENMFNAGVSFKIGQGSGVTTSRTAMAKKIESLENTVDQQNKKIAELEALIQQYIGKKA
ncbi:ESPR-type extended signal peptide-containing protein [uncultured Megasphaera sp.]|uniref:ESPR-type extended signal peptide-containing protein n=1 Tax=uncultured Megasphaera sp. TaxID=165188 RepID=UPI00286924D7|nr:ESPR-type extended signal peptide-containing protein [uncultured Megasphaera sp.]